MAGAATSEIMKRDAPVLAAITALDVAAISAAAAVVAPLTAWLASVGVRRHEREMARDSRLYVDLRDAYVDLLNHLYRIRTAIARSEPREYTTAQDIPPELVKLARDKKFFDSNRQALARAAALGSEDVVEKLQRNARAHDTFWAELNDAEIGLPGAAERYEEARDSFTASLDELARAIRTDLRR
jgi:hypothetical protein